MKQQKSLHKVLTENIGFVFVLPWLIGFLFVYQRSLQQIRAAI